MREPHARIDVKPHATDPKYGSLHIYMPIVDDTDTYIRYAEQFNRELADKFAAIQSTH